MSKHHESTPASTEVKVGGAAPSKGGLKNRPLLVVLCVVVFAALGSALLLASHADSNAYQLYRLASGSNHFYTSSATEEASAIKSGYHLEDTYPYNNEPGSNPIPVYRYRQGTSNHFYTESKAEGDAAVNSKTGWVYEGIGFYASSSAKVPVNFCRQTWYRLANGSNHFYTPSATEAQLIQQPDHGGWKLESSSAFKLDYLCGTPAGVPAPTTTPKPAPAPAPTPTPVKTTPAPVIAAYSGNNDGCGGNATHYYGPTHVGQANYGTSSVCKCSNGKVIAYPNVYPSPYPYTTKNPGCTNNTPAVSGSSSQNTSRTSTSGSKFVDDGCGPSGSLTSKATHTCKCGGWTAHPGVPYSQTLNGSPRSTAEAKCQPTKSNSGVTCATKGQIVPITGGTKCLYDGSVHCTVPGYKPAESGGGLYCQGSGTSGSSRPLKTCLSVYGTLGKQGGTNLCNLPPPEISPGVWDPTSFPTASCVPNNTYLTPRGWDCNIK